MSSCDFADLKPGMVCEHEDGTRRVVHALDPSAVNRGGHVYWSRSWPDGSRDGLHSATSKEWNRWAARARVVEQGEGE